MIHADFYEPEARMFRAEQVAHMGRCCDEDGCGQRVCPDALPESEGWRACRFCYDRDGTLFPDGRIVCAMCY